MTPRIKQISQMLLDSFLKDPMQHEEPKKKPLHLFEGYGVELEYMIVDRETMAIRSLADAVLAAVGQPGAREVECGPLAWSNELAMHVIELKTNGPAASLARLEGFFERDLGRINTLLAEHNACLIGSAMHPWMKPDAEAQLWQQEDAEIYDALDRIFGCTGHGWKNLQSAHLNLPFYDDAEFVKLHAAIRLVLPLIPALAAASPFMDGVDTGILNNRLMVYQGHCRRFPQAMGPVVPEAVDSIAAYHAEILEPIYEALKPYDPEGILAFEWINARGAIARFDRQTIEIRLVDVQETPAADIAIAKAIAGAVQWLTGQTSGRQPHGNSIPSERLRELLQLTIHEGAAAKINDAEYLRLLGMNDSSAAAKIIWRHLLGQVHDLPDSDRVILEAILEHGTLAERMKKCAGGNGGGFLTVCQQLADCLAQGKMLLP